MGISRGTTVRAARVGLAAVALVGLAAGVQPRQLHFGAASPVPAGSQARAMAERAGIDVDGSVASIRHRVRATRAGDLAASDAAYRVAFDRRGFSVTPNGSHDHLDVAVDQVARGGRTLSITSTTTTATTATTGWTGDGARAERTLLPSVQERVTAKDGQVEWDVLLDAAPAGSGDLTVRADLRGVGRAVTTRDGLDVELAGGAHVDVGALVVNDRTGAELDRSVPRVVDGQLLLTVPDAVLRTAAYPLTLDPTVSPERVASIADNDQSAPAVAFDGTNYMVVWQDNRNTVYDIYGTRIRPDGLVLDPDGILVTTNTSGSNQFEPDITFFGPDYLVVWADGRNGNSGIYGARVHTNGTVFDVQAAPISTIRDASKGHPRIGFDGGDNALIVWDETMHGNAGVYGTRFTRQAGVVDPNGITIAVGPGPNAPAVTYYGPNFLVAWAKSETTSTGMTDSNIWATRVTTGGQVLDSPVLFSGASGFQSGPSMAFDGTDVLIAWTDSRNGNADVYGTRWDTSHGLLDPAGFPIASTSNREAEPVVGANGGFLVAWLDGRSGQDHVYATRVGDDRSIKDPGGFVVSTSTHAEADLAIVKGKDTQWAVAYDRANPTDDLFFRTVTPK